MFRQAFDCLAHALNRVSGCSFPEASESRSLEPVLGEKRSAPPVEGEHIGKRRCVRADSSQELHISHPLAGIVSPELILEWDEARKTSESIEFRTGEKVTPGHAPVDAWIVKTMQSPDGPGIAASIKQSAIENKEDVFGLAREACRVMAAQVSHDITVLGKRENFSRNDEGILERLMEELVQFSRQECTYRKWMELASRYTNVTGWAYYLANPDEFDLLGENSVLRKIPETLAEVEHYDWAEITNCFHEPDKYIDRERQRIIRLVSPKTFAASNVHFFSILHKKGSYMLPTFQELGVKDLNFNQHMPVSYGGIMLAKMTHADGYNLTRADFYEHDIGHAVDSNVSVIYQRQKTLSATLRHKLVTILYKYQGDLDDLGYTANKSLFDALELQVFVMGHEKGMQIEDAIYCRKVHSSLPVNYVPNTATEYIVEYFDDKRFESLRDKYGHCVTYDVKEKRERASEVLLLAEKIMQQVCVELLSAVTVDELSPDAYEKALQAVIKKRKSRERELN